MSKKVYITRRIPEKATEMLQAKGYEVDVSEKDGVLTRDELLFALKAKPYDAVLCLLTDKIDGEVFAAVPTAKIFANYAVGFDNLNIEDAKKANVMLSNTPADSVSQSVAEHALALMVSVGRRIVEADQFVRDGQYHGWAPLVFLTPDLFGRTLAIIGAGRIGSRLATFAAKGFGMKIVYFDIRRNEQLEKDLGAEFKPNLDEALKAADYISLHVNLTEENHHLINKERLAMMKPEAVIVNTARGPVIDEAALVEALKVKQIAGAGLDVFEFEPKLVDGLAQLPNVVLTPHIASATFEVRDDMARIAAENIIAALEGQTPANLVK